LDEPGLEVVAINDLMTLENAAIYLNMTAFMEGMKTKYPLKDLISRSTIRRSCLFPKSTGESSLKTWLLMWLWNAPAQRRRCGKAYPGLYEKVVISGLQQQVHRPSFTE
jgi:hypothetical protein